MSQDFICPIPHPPGDEVLLAHGGAGRLAQRLLDDVFRPALANASLDERHDAATFTAETGRLAFSTDAFVVSPWKFPGGDIGSLAVHGTVNDLAMSGATPLALSMAFILEEGFKIADLKEVVASMAAAAAKAKVSVVAADTKVVQRGKGDGLFIASSGVGKVISPTPILPSSVREGDVILLSGDVGRHGVAVKAALDEMGFEPSIESDSALVHEPVLRMIEAGVRIRALRDVTRGGLATVLHEIATDGSVGVHIDESKIAVNEDVSSVCEVLGLDPLYVACEGRFVAFVHPGDVDLALEILREHEVSCDAKPIGVATSRQGLVTMRGRIGVDRILDLLSGEQLPRIC